MGFIDDTLGTNIFGKNSTDRALEAQQAGADKALASQERMYNQTREDNMPWLEAGRDSLATLTGQMPELTRSFSADDFQKDPGYDFRMQEGQKALERSAAAKGGLMGGGFAKALSRYGQDYASNEYQNAYNRFNNDQANRFNRLAGIAGVGQSAAQNLGNVNMAQGQNMANIYTGLGNAQASAEIAQGNRFSNLLGQGAQAIASAPKGGWVDKGMSAMFSDSRLKQNIKPIPQAEILEFRKTIKPYFFEYISDEYGVGEHAGIMAQDLEKSKLGRMAVFENEKGEKLVDLKKLIPILVASLSQEVA